MKKAHVRFLTLFLAAIVAFSAILMSGCNDSSDEITTPAQTTPPPPDVTTEAPPEIKYSEGLEYFYRESTNSYCLKGIGSCTDSDLFIPPEHNGLPVTSIVSLAFNNCDFIKTVTVPSSVSYIEREAFTNCDALESAFLSEGVNIVSICVFRHCPALKSITLPKSLTEVHNAAFYTAEKNVDLYYAGTVSDWCNIKFTDGGVFVGNLYSQGKLVEHVTLSAEDAEKGKCAFSGCHSIKSVTIAEGAKRIAQEAFSLCVSLESLTLPSTLTEIGSCAFANCESLTNVTFPDGLKKIEGAAFSFCSLENIILPEGVEEIGINAFQHCKITDVTVPGSVKKVVSTFSSCPELKTATLLYGVEALDFNAFGLCPKIESIVIPVSVTSIGDRTFQNCESLTDIYYEGTLGQWFDIKKSYYGWFNNTPLTIHCTDEDMTYKK